MATARMDGQIISTQVTPHHLSRSERAIHSERGREQRRNSHATPMAGRPEAANILHHARGQLGRAAAPLADRAVPVMSVLSVV